MATSITTTVMKTNIIVLRMFLSYELASSGWLTSALGDGALTLEAKLESVLLMGHGPLQVNRCQQRENISLQECDKQVKHEKDDRDDHRNQREERARHGVTGKHICVKSDAQRHHAREMADDLDREEQPCQPPHGPREVLQIADGPLLLDALNVVVEKRDERATQRYLDGAGRRFERRNQPDQIAEQNKQKQRAEEWCEPLAVLTDDLAALIGDEVVHELSEVPQAARLVHGEAAANHQEKQQENADHQDFHRHVIADRGGRIGRVKGRR